MGKSKEKQLEKVAKKVSDQIKKDNVEILEFENLSPDEERKYALLREILEKVMSSLDGSLVNLEKAIKQYEQVKTWLEYIKDKEMTEQEKKDYETQLEGQNKQLRQIEDAVKGQQDILIYLTRIYGETEGAVQPNKKVLIRDSVKQWLKLLPLLELLVHSQKQGQNQ
jgi:hypothetical protein